jgi:hypothetical protein
MKPTSWHEAFKVDSDCVAQVYVGESRSSGYAGDGYVAGCEIPRAQGPTPDLARKGLVDRLRRLADLLEQSPIS